jgi:hypothetical protein
LWERSPRRAPRSLFAAGFAETKALLKEVHLYFLSKTIVLLAEGGEGRKYLGERNKAIRATSLVDGSQPPTCTKTSVQCASD